MHRSSQNPSKPIWRVDFAARGQQGMNYFTKASVILDSGLILLALKRLFELLTPWWICFLQMCSFSIHMMERGAFLGMCLSAVWTLILMAPIHCRGSIVNLIHLSKSLYIQKLTHLHLKSCFSAHSHSEFIFSTFLAELFFWYDIHLLFILDEVVLRTSRKVWYFTEYPSKSPNVFC